MDQLQSKSVVVGARNRAHLEELIGPVGSAMLRTPTARCSSLIADICEVGEYGNVGY
jgi:hypothetical protein